MDFPGTGAPTRRSLLKRLLPAFTGLLALAGCVTNPVTGERELGLVTDQQERAIGEEQYAPSRQMQGGDYVLDPGVVAYVQRIGQRLAGVSDRALPYEFSIINNSVPNAWALPGGKIAVNRGLLYELGSEAELAAVLGHEIVHAAARHGAQAMQRGLLLQGALLATAIASRDNDYAQYVVGGAQVAAQLIHQKYGRSAELEADRYGMIYMDRAGYDPSGAVALQETFLRLSEGRDPGWLAGLFASHPPSRERLDANRATAAELGHGGETGGDAYLAATEQLRTTRPAYEAYDKGRAALADGDPRKAMRLADDAIEIEPAEALFYGLKGDVAFALRDYEEAVDYYDHAIANNDAYFKFYLGRGEAYRRLGQIERAEQDLTASAQLLPTADAVTALGQIAESRGDVERAIGLYQNAAQSTTPAGRTAAERLIVLDLPRRPDRYINIGRQVDRRGNVYLELVNRTPVRIGGISVTLAYRDASGRVRQEARRYSGIIPAGGTGVMMLGSQYAAVFDTLQAQVTGANPVEP